MQDIRHISCIVAREVIKAAAADGHVGCPQALEALAKGDDALLHWVSTHQMFTPAYARYRWVGWCWVAHSATVAVLTTRCVYCHAMLSC